LFQLLTLSHQAQTYYPLLCILPVGKIFAKIFDDSKNIFGQYKRCICHHFLFRIFFYIPFMVVIQKYLDTDIHRQIKRQKGRQMSSLIFWLFDAAGGGGRGFCETMFKKRLMELCCSLNL